MSVVGFCSVFGAVNGAVASDLIYFCGISGAYGSPPDTVYNITPGTSVSLSQNSGGCYPSESWQEFGGWICYERYEQPLVYGGGTSVQDDTSYQVNNGYTLTMPSNGHNVRCHANWVPKQYTVNYYCNMTGNQLITGAAFTANVMFTLLSNVSSCNVDSTEYSFVGWHCEAVGYSTSLLNAGDQATFYDNTNCYAVWEEITPCDPGQVVDTEILGDAVNGWGDVMQLSNVSIQAMCSNTPGTTWAEEGNPSSTSGPYCWCQATSALNTPLSNYPWVYVGYDVDNDSSSVSCDTTNCEDLCESSICFKDPGCFFNTHLLKKNICGYNVSYDCGSHGTLVNSNQQPVGVVMDANYAISDVSSICSFDTGYVPDSDASHVILDGWVCTADNGNSSQSNYWLSYNPNGTNVWSYADNYTCTAQWTCDIGYTMVDNQCVLDSCSIILNPNNGTGAKQGGDSSNTANNLKTIYSQYGNGVYKTNISGILSNQMTGQSGLDDIPPSPALGIPVGRTVTYTFDAQTTAPTNPETGFQYSVTNPSDIVKQRSFVGYYSITNVGATAPMLWLSQNADKQCIDDNGYITSYGQSTADSVAQNNGSCPTTWYAQYDCKNSGSLPNVPLSGYTVTRWKAGNTNIAANAGGIAMCVDQNFEAVWQANTYTITYAPGEIGGNNEDRSVKFDTNTYVDGTTPLNAISNPFSATGYVFDKWSSNHNVGTGAGTQTDYDEGDSFGYYKVGGNTIITALWNCDEENGYYRNQDTGQCELAYSLTYGCGTATASTWTNGQYEDANGPYVANTSVATLSSASGCTTPSNVSLSGWDCGGADPIVPGNNITITGNTTCTAQWDCDTGYQMVDGECVRLLYHVTYSCIGSSSTASSTGTPPQDDTDYEYNDSVTTPTIESATANGGCANSAYPLLQSWVCNGVSVQPGESFYITGDTLCIPNWSRNIIEINLLAPDVSEWGNSHKIYSWTYKGAHLNSTSSNSFMTQNTNELPSTDIPTRTGYEFTGYYKDISGAVQYILPNGFITQQGMEDSKWSGYLAGYPNNWYAGWEVNTYNIEYVLNGGTHGADHPATATYDVEFSVSNPTRTGAYVFNGWNITGMDSITHYYGSNQTTENTISNTSETTFKNLRSTSGTVTFTAQWDCEAGYEQVDNQCVPSAYTLTYTCGTGTGSSWTDANSPFTAGADTVVNTLLASDVESHCTAPTNNQFSYWKCNDANVIAGNPIIMNADKTCVAQWKSAVINLEWFSDDTEYTNNPQSCVYGTINGIAPISHPNKEGHTFLGWNVSSYQCDLSDMTPSVNGSKREWLNHNGSSSQGSLEAMFGLTENDTFGCLFPYGKVIGASRCSTVDGTNAQPGTPSPDYEGGHCWCKLIRLIKNDGQQCDLSYSPWLYFGFVSQCDQGCAETCAYQIMYKNLFRSAAYSHL